MINVYYFIVHKFENNRRALPVESFFYFLKINKTINRTKINQIQKDLLFK